MKRNWMTNGYYSIEFIDGKVSYLNQVLLPHEEVYVETDDYERIALAIERLEVRGAPLIGISAAYGLAVAMKKDRSDEHFEKVYARLQRTRPTAVNLFWALKAMREAKQTCDDASKLYDVLLDKAKEIHQDDIDKCDKMGEHGLAIFKKKSVVLTHCNTGKLATGGDGTAFSVIKKAFEHDKVSFVYADETRPLLQGGRLTAYELDKCGIPFAIQPDSAAAFLMKQNKIDLVITGSDRITTNGDAANKIGTYSLAVLCKHHNIPFYIAAPTSTIDREMKTGDDIPIEERKNEEVTSAKGHPITLERYGVYNPAFDVTPASLIHGIITEEGLFTPPYDFSL